MTTLNRTEQMAQAWLKVCAALDKCAPNWQERASNSADAAVATIEAMALDSDELTNILGSDGGASCHA